MTDWPQAGTQTEPLVRLLVFILLFAAFASWELLAPRRALHDTKSRRWATNLAMFGLDILLLRLLFPLAAVGVALYAEQTNLGLLPQLPLPQWLRVLAAVLALDLLIYWQHRLFHQIPLLWRLHKVHHTDLDIDLTTGVRFHPVEILLSMLIKLAAVVALGAPPLAVLLFEVLLNGTSLFNHANIRLAPAWDRWLRLLVVTPDMHRVHHSVRPRETNSNYGFNIPWWDRLFGSYRAQPSDGHTGMQIGLAQIRARLSLGALLLLPLHARGQQGTN